MSQRPTVAPTVWQHHSAAAHTRPGMAAAVAAVAAAAEQGGVAAVRAALRALAAETSGPAPGGAATPTSTLAAPPPLGAAAIRDFARAAPSGQLGAVAGELGAAIGAVMRGAAPAATGDNLAALLQAGTHVCVSADRAAIAAMLRALVAAGTVVTEAFGDRARRQLTILLARALRRCPAVALIVVDGLLRPAVDGLPPSCGAVHATLTMLSDLTRGLVLSLELLQATSGDGAVAHGAYTRLLQSVAGVLGAQSRPLVRPTHLPAGGPPPPPPPPDAALRVLGHMRAANHKGWSNALRALPPSYREAVSAHSDKINAAVAAGGVLAAAVASRAASSSMARAAGRAGGGYAHALPPALAPTSSRAPLTASPHSSALDRAATAQGPGGATAPTARRSSSVPVPAAVPAVFIAAIAASPPPPPSSSGCLDDMDPSQCNTSAGSSADCGHDVADDDDGTRDMAPPRTPRVPAAVTLPRFATVDPTVAATDAATSPPASSAASSGVTIASTEESGGVRTAGPRCAPPGHRAGPVRAFPLSADSPRLPGASSFQRPSTGAAPSLSHTQPLLGLSAPLRRSSSLRACTPPPRRPSVGSASTGRLSIYSLQSAQSAARPPTSSSSGGGCGGGGVNSPSGGVSRSSHRELLSSSMSICSDSTSDWAAGAFTSAGMTPLGAPAPSWPTAAGIEQVDVASSRPTAPPPPSELRECANSALAPCAALGDDHLVFVAAAAPGECNLGGVQSSPDLPCDDAALLSTSSAGGSRHVFSMRVGGRRRSSSYSALARDRTHSVSRAATPNTCEDDSVPSARGGCGARGRLSSLGAAVEGCMLLDAAALVSDSVFQHPDDRNGAPVRVEPTPAQAALSSVAPAMRRLRARSRSVTARACSLPLLDGLSSGSGLLGPGSMSDGLLPLQSPSRSDQGVDEAEGSASSYRAERAGGARAVRTSSLPSPFAVPSLGEAQPVYPASSELTPLPNPAATAPAALATVSSGLQADGTQWEVQFGALLLLRRLAVHHPEVLLLPAAAVASSTSVVGVRTAHTGTTSALAPAATVRARARGHSAGSLALAVTASPPARRPAALQAPDSPGGLAGGGAGSSALAALLPPLLACADSLRSSVSRHALMALADVWCSEPLAGALDSGGGEVESSLALLLRRACDTSAFLSDAAGAALRVLVTHACESRLLAALLAACAHHNTALRCAAAPWLDRAVAHAVAKRGGGGVSARGAAAQQPAAQPQLQGRDVTVRLLQAACAQLAEGSPAARHAGHRLVRRLAAAGWADGRALGRLPDRDSQRLREALGREPPADTGA